MGRLIVGAMGLDHFLERIADGDLVITPGDRADIVAGSLAAHLSGTYPAIAGLVLTGGLIAPAVHRLVDGYGHVGIPVIAAGDDTYTVTSAVTAVRGSITARSPRKIAAAVAGFKDGVDTSALVERITQARPTRTTPLMFEHALIERARADRRHIVLPEGNDDRILTAADQLLHAARGRPDRARDRARRPGPRRGARADPAGGADRGPADLAGPQGLRRDLPRAAPAQGRHRWTRRSTRWATRRTSAP